MSQQTVPDAAFQALFERLLEKRAHLAFVSYALSAPGPLVTADGVRVAQSSYDSAKGKTRPLYRVGSVRELCQLPWLEPGRGLGLRIHQDGLYPPGILAVDTGPEFVRPPASWRNPVVVKTERGFHAYAPEQPWSRGSYESPETVEGVDQAWLRIGATRGQWVLRWGPKNGVWPVIL